MKYTWKLVQELKPSLLMVLAQVAYASANVLYKLAINDGMSIMVVTAYRHIFGAAFSLSLALIFERKNMPKLTWRVLSMSFFCGLFGGSLAQNLYFIGLAWVSATFATSVYNLVPVITFIFSVLCGFEMLNLRTAAARVKVLGSIIGISGSMLLTFFKGGEINIWTFHINLLHKNQNGHIATLHADHSGRKWLGVLCGLASGFSFSSWLIIQTKMSKEYPSLRHHSSTALMTLMAAIQATVFALCVEKDWSQWKLGWSIRLLTAAFSGIVVSGLVVIVTTWCVRLRGPLYASVFNPLSLVIVAIFSPLVLDENLYVGSKEMRLESSEKENFEATAAVVITTLDHDNSDYGNNSHTISS
ncbi:WAT1-related protein At1g25270 isoform X2 [Cajanus cajan]|uniref:WAT1-related protein At1g25270 isoform X2 n=1 Tax=Cajanus cajan TaxID=3821 RepID=UPI0010FAE574|nr:WAT1-related protein At1g25270 isoform X2 [Cajanus cajan]